MRIRSGQVEGCLSGQMHTIRGDGQLSIGDLAQLCATIGGLWMRSKGPLPEATRRRILRRDRWRCHYCGGDADTVDHIVPRLEGGGDADANLVAACRSCNSAKNGQPYAEFKASGWRPMKPRARPRRVAPPCGLSIEARGLRELLPELSGPEGFNKEALMEFAGIGRTKCERILRELYEAGEVVTRIDRGADGRLYGKRLFIAGTAEDRDAG